MDSLGSLPGRLGLHETPGMANLRRQWIAAMQRNSTLARPMAIAYGTAAMAVIEELSGDDYAKAQIGLVVSQGLARISAGRREDGEADLHQAAYSARQEGFSAIAQELERALARRW